MKRKLLILLPFVLALSAFAQIPNYVPTNGLVGWWPFNGNANDESGNGNNGTVNGATLTTDRFGTTNKAYYFSSSGCGTRIDVNVNTSQIQTGLTVSTWILRSGNGCIGPRVLEFYNTLGNPGSMDIGWDNSGFGNIGSYTSTGFVVASDWPKPSNNTWIHLVYTNDGVFGRFYANGILFNTLPSSGSPILAGNGAFGRKNNPSYDAFNGKIDDIGIWNRALTQQEITNLYTYSVPPACSITASANALCPGSPVNLQFQSNVLTSDTIIKPANNSIPIIGSTFEYSGTTPASGWAITSGGWNTGSLPYVGVNTGAVPNSTFWPLGSTYYLRKTIDLSGYNLNTIQYFVAVDNGYSLYVNGTLVNSNNQGGPATEWEYSGTVPSNLLVNGVNYIAFIITDDGAGAAVFNCMVKGQPYSPTYSWSPGGATTPSITVSPTQTTTYTATTTVNGQSCTASQTVTVNNPTANAGADVIKTCVQNPNGASLGATAVAGVQYAWSPASGLSATNVSNPTTNPSTNTTYTLTTTDANGCTATDQVVVTVNTTAPIANAGNDANITCAQNPTGVGLGTAPVSGITYVWTPGTGLSSTAISNPAANPLTTSTYTVTATNPANGCTATDQVVVTVNTTVPIVSAGNDVNITCIQNTTGAGVGMNPVAGINYAWSPSSGLSSGTIANPIANPQSTSSFTLTATNPANGCTASDQVVVTVNNTPPPVNAGVDQTVCAGSSVTLTGAGANSYVWSNNVSDGVAFVPVSTDTYTLTGTNNTNGCSASDQVVITVNGLPNVVQPVDQVVCCQAVLSPIVFLSSLPGTSFSWQAQQNPNITGYPLSGTGSIPTMILSNSALNTQALTFTVTPTLNGCTGSPVSFSINVLPCAVFVVQPTSQTVCAGSNLNPILFTGNYTSVDWVNSNVQTGLPGSGSGDIGLALLTNTSPTTITSSFTVVPTYTDPVFIGASCQGPAQSFTISVLPQPTVNAGADQTVCAGTAVTLSGSGSNSYVWNNNVSDGVPFVPASTSTFTVVGTDVNGCQNSDQVTVNVNALPSVSAGSDQTICNGDTLVLSGTGAITFVWDNGVIDGVGFSPVSSSTYAVIGTDANNCQDADSVTVTINDPSFSTLTESALDSYTLNGTTYTQSGTFTQVLTNAAGCDSTITLNLTLSFTGLGDPLQGIRIFPNPANDVLQIESTSAFNGVFRIYDATGRMVLKGDFTGTNTNIDVRNLAPGTYSFQATNWTERIVVIRR